VLAKTFIPAGEVRVLHLHLFQAQLKAIEEEPEGEVPRNEREVRDGDFLAHEILLVGENTIQDGDDSDDLLRDVSDVKHQSDHETRTHLLLVTFDGSRQFKLVEPHEVCSLAVVRSL
jgi:hypothetical protein